MDLVPNNHGRAGVFAVAKRRVLVLRLPCSIVCLENKAVKARVKDSQQVAASGLSNRRGFRIRIVGFARLRFDLYFVSDDIVVVASELRFVKQKVHYSLVNVDETLISGPCSAMIPL